MSEETPNVDAPADAPADTPARRTPYEMVFGEEFEARTFPRIEEEAREQEVDARHPERFGFLSLAGDAVRAVVPPDAPPEALDQYRALLYQAFNFWRYGKRVYVLEPSVARYLIEAAPSLSDWELKLPYPSIYLQLPRNLFWASISPDSTPESVDGFFLTEAHGEDSFGRPFRRIEVLVVLGIRRDRAGFSVIPFGTAAGPGIAAEWADAPGREEGAEFENVLPGGEIGGLYSIMTTIEALKLTSRALWYVDSYPEDVELEVVAEPRAAERGDSPPLPRLPYHRVSLGEH